jgi:hypothetical protein
MTMKYFVTILMLLFATTTAASAVEMPKELWGEWCTRDENYERLTKCKAEPDGIGETFVRGIDRNGDGGEHSMCKPFEVRKQGNTWIVKARCVAIEWEDDGSFGAKSFTTHYTRSGAYLLMKAK